MEYIGFIIVSALKEKVSGRKSNYNFFKVLIYLTH